MKQYSDNITVTAGWAVIFGINAFPDIPLNIDGFRACLDTLSTTAQTIKAEINNQRDSVPSVLLLSLPRFTKINSGNYILNSPFFALGGHIFRRGAALAFDEKGVCTTKTSSTFYEGTVLPAQFVETKYDTYNGEPLTSIQESTLESLDIDSSFLDASAAEGFVMAKVLSIYLPDLKPSYSGEVWAGYTPEVKASVDSHRDVNESASRCGIHDKYDRYAIQFTNKSQPFAYINVEEINTIHNISSDLNSEIFDQDNANDFSSSEYNTEALSDIYKKLAI